MEKLMGRIRHLMNAAVNAFVLFAEPNLTDIWRQRQTTLRSLHYE